MAIGDRVTFGRIEQAKRELAAWFAERQKLYTLSALGGLSVEDEFLLDLERDRLKEQHERHLAFLREHPGINQGGPGGSTGLAGGPGGPG